MTLNTPIQQTRTNYLLRVTLAVVLVFAALHVSTHDIETSDDIDSQEHCQVCRLNQLPISDLPTLAWIVPLLALILLRPIPALQHPTKIHLSSFSARAPPLVLIQY